MKDNKSGLLTGADDNPVIFPAFKSHLVINHLQRSEELYIFTLIHVRDLNAIFLRTVRLITNTNYILYKYIDIKREIL